MLFARAIDSLLGCIIAQNFWRMHEESDGRTVECGQRIASHESGPPSLFGESEMQSYFFPAWAHPRYSAYPFSSEGPMFKVRTYFLENIAKNEERGYSVYSSVAACPELRATFFARISGKNRIASQKSSFLHFKYLLSSDSVLGLSSKTASSFISSGAGEEHSIR